MNTNEHEFFAPKPHRGEAQISVCICVYLWIILFASGCGGGGGGAGGGGGGGNQPTTTTVTIRGRVNVPPAADPTFFASRAAGKAGPYEAGYIPLVGAAVTVEGNSAVTTTDSDGAFTLALTYAGSAADYPIKVSIVKNMIVLKKYVTEADKHLPFQVTPQTTAAALAYDRLTEQGATGLDIADMEYSAYKWTSLPIGNIASAISSLLTSGAVVNLTTPLTEQGSVLIKVNVLTDVEAPELNNVELSSSTVNGGDSVQVTVWSKEETGMSDDSYVYLFWHSSLVADANLEDWQYNSASGLWYASATLDIPAYASTGTCYLSLTMRDSLSNYAPLYSSQDSYHVPSSDYQFETSNKLPSLTIASSSSDTTAPELVSIEASNTTIAEAGDTATLRFTIRETESGLDYMGARVTDDGAENYAENSCYSFSAGSQPGEYTCEVSFGDTDFEATGTYTLTTIFIIDKADNYTRYEYDEVPEPPVITVNYAPLADDLAFEITNASFSPSSPTSGAKMQISLSLNADSRPNYIYANYSKDGDPPSNSVYFSLTTTDTSDTGPWTYTGSATLSPYSATGTFKAYSAGLNKYSEPSWYKSYYRSNSEEDADFLDQFPSFTLSSNSHTDTEAPAYSSFQLASGSFVRGGQFKATATVTDTGYPSYAYINLRHETSSEPNAYYYMRCYNVFPGAAAGQWVFEIDETLPSNLEPGSWRVNSVTTYDLAGNDSYEQPSGVTFTLF